MPTTVDLQQDGPVAVVTLSRPDKHNALNREMSQQLSVALDRLEKDESVRVVIITGSGDKAFCAGADMGEVLERTVQPEDGGQDPTDAIRRLMAFTKPVIAAINGYAFGAGALLAIACDIRLAADTASFRFPGAAYGLVVGASQLPRIVGVPKAKEIIFTARVVDAQEAFSIGLVNHVVPLAELIEAARRMAQSIAENSLGALRSSKQVIDAVTDAGAAAALEREANRQLRASPEHQQRFGQAAARVLRPGE